MAAIKALQASAEKWNRRAAAAGQDLVAGVRNPKRPWAESTIAAEDNYIAGVTAAANAGRFGRGVAAAGDTKWQTNAIAKGQTRYAQGVNLAVGSWQSGFRVFHDAFTAHTLSARGPRGSEQNFALSTEVQRLFAATKRAQSGG